MGRVLDGLSALKIRGFRMRPVAKLRKIDFRFGYIRFFRTLTIETNSVRQGKSTARFLQLRKDKPAENPRL
jgi:hypothetical protein